MSTQLLELQELSGLTAIFCELIKNTNESSLSPSLSIPGAKAAIMLLDKLIEEKTKRIARMNGVD
jgi:hypothetical protein